MKKINKVNRYNETYTFTEIDENTVEMTGPFKHYRTAYENDYEEAYAAYLKKCNALEEPDWDLVYDVPVENCVRPLTFLEFTEEVHKEYFIENPVLRQFSLLVKSDPETIHMIDPSGGPYIARGSDLNHLFDDFKPRVINEIKIVKSNKDKIKVLLTYTS